MNEAIKVVVRWGLEAKRKSLSNIDEASVEESFSRKNQLNDKSLGKILNLSIRSNQSGMKPAGGSLGSNSPANRHVDAAAAELI